MTEELYRRLQSLGSFDLKTSSWIATPDDIRSKGGALFCERRYDTVFTFHNGADADSEDIFLSEYRLNSKSIVRILPETERLMHNFRFVEMSEYVPFRRTLLVSVPFGRT